MNSPSTYPPCEIDRPGCVNNVVCLRWVQDAAVAHWSAVATEQEKKRLLSLVMRHEFDDKRPAFAGETVVARTWIWKKTRNKVSRHKKLNSISMT